MSQRTAIPESKERLAIIREILRHPIQNGKLLVELGATSMTATVALLAGPAVIEETATRIGIDLSTESLAFAGECAGYDFDYDPPKCIPFPPIVTVAPTPPSAPAPSTGDTTPKPPATTPAPTLPTTYETLDLDLDGDGSISKLQVASIGGNKVGESTIPCSDVLICDFNDLEPFQEGGIGEQGVVELDAFLGSRGVDLYELPNELKGLEPVLLQIGRSVNPSRFADTLSAVFSFSGSQLPEVTTTSSTSTTTTAVPQTTIALPSTSENVQQPISTSSTLEVASPGTSNPESTSTEAIQIDVPVASEGDDVNIIVSSGVAVVAIILVGSMAFAIVRKRHHEETGNGPSVATR